MVFNSYTFLLFISTLVALYYGLRSWRARKALLLVASYVFYGVWNPPFVLLLVFSTLVDWTAARNIAAAPTDGRRKLWVTVSLMSNLGILALFKYADFAMESFQYLASAAGVQFEPVQLGFVLPVGISFYTFQTLSYTLDTYRGNMRPGRSFLDYALYVTFFPQLVAGPIVRAVDFLPQCEKPKVLNWQRLTWGATLVLVGVTQKSVLADGFFAPIVERVYAAQGTPGFIDAWVGTLAFAGQIYNDFAGYSTCAIGTALCLGFELPENFRYPYAAIGFSDFWRRWHISLSTWLRDYLYISLGGNRRGATRTNINLMLTMLLGGLWHGASWTFVVWGGLHGSYLVAEKGVKRLIGNSEWATGRLAKLVGALLTFGLVCVTWVFFRADTFGEAFTVTRAMLGLAGFGRSMVRGEDVVITVGLTGAILAYQWWMRGRVLSELAGRTRWPVRAVAVAAMLVGIVNMSGDDRAFIYFQF